MFPPFSGERRPLDNFDIPMLAHRIGCGEDELRAFLEVEAASRGFDSQGRPRMLFEPHVFYRNLDPSVRTEAVKRGLAYRRWGEQSYPSDSYPRLEQACELDEDAALMSCSIGLSQVLVENYSSIGYSSPQEMWQMFMDDEQEHVEAMVRYILVNGIDDDLREHRWEVVARVYNGPGYAKHNYHGRMKEAFEKFRRVPDVAWSPDSVEEGPGDASREELRTIQKSLRELGYVEVGYVDGKWGSKTRAGVLAFRADNGLPIAPNIDDEFKRQLLKAKPRAVSQKRAVVSVEQVRKSGSKTIKAADTADVTGKVLAGGGAVVAISNAVTQATDQANAVSALFDSIAPVVDTLKAMGPYLLIAAGAFIVWQMWKARQARVDDERSGKNAGRIPD